MHASHPLAALVTVLLIMVGQSESIAAAVDTQPEVNRRIETMLRTDGLVIGNAKFLTQEILLEVYEGHGFSPFWTRPARIRELIGLINDSPDHGLNPADYDIEQLQKVLQRRASSPSAKFEAEADILLTESLLRYGYHRRFGKVEGNKLDPDINFRRESFLKQAPSVTIVQALECASLTDFVEMAAPTGPAYRDLQHQLRRYREIASAGGWPSVPTGRTLKLGDQDSRVSAIRRRLVATGDLPAGATTDSTQFDQELETALKKFQTRHSLDDDGLGGRQSVAAMNIAVETRIDQLRISLERLRWVNQEATQTFVAVNIAGFRAFFYKDGVLEWSTRAMVGKHYRQTPVFRGDIAYLEFNPTWTIPPTILREDTLPAIKNDPNYLASRNISVIDGDGKIVDPSTVDWNRFNKGVPYTLRQNPGPNNALGTVKFIFPNKHFVFLHDTPHRELFDHTERAFSSGCVRIEDPLMLAELVLDDPLKYSRSALEDIVASRKTRRIKPSGTIPVVMIYLTASVEPGGNVRFYKDIYSRDQKVLEALNGPVIFTPPSN